MAKGYRRLRGRIIEKFGSVSAFSDRIGKARNGVSVKLNGKVKFNTNDIRQWAEALEITPEEIGVYFFE